MSDGMGRVHYHYLGFGGGGVGGGHLGFGNFRRFEIKENSP